MVQEDDWPRIKAVLADALELPAAERTAFAKAACGGDEVLRRQVATYLHEDALAAGFIEHPFFSIPRDDEPEEDQSDDRLGPYRLARRLGRGGMGTVYLAERDDGELDHRVAVKILKRGLDTKELVRRFRAERQILAHLEHPNVARFLDAGTTEDGRPYFVMEYVDGQPLDVWCGERQLDVRDRVRLFRKVLEAVGFAHRNLVVHRDLKPANILVTASGTPKLLDFGVAKLLYEGAGSRMTVTALGPGPLTPSYASPEQVRGEPISTATDVYSLGVVLYELLTGRVPYRVTGRGAAEMARVICETPPRRPSNAAGKRRYPDAASVSGTDSAWHLRRSLRGDLDNIILKALSKEPDRRFSSVEQFSEDLERYLTGQPVRSRPGGWIYRAAKFGRRNALAVSLALISIVLSAIFTATLIVQRSEIVSQRDQAKQLAEFLTGLAWELDGAYGGEVPDPAVVDSLAQEMEAELADLPRLRSLMRDTLGRINTRLGRHDIAEPLLQSTLDERRKLLGPRHHSVAESLLNLANLKIEQGQYAVAEEHMLQALAIQRQAFPEGEPALARGLHNLASFLRRDRPENAERFAREALAMKERLFGPEHLEVAVTLNVRGTILRDLERHDEAEDHYRRAITLYRKLDDEPNPGLARALNNLAGLLGTEQGSEEVVSLYAESLGIRRRQKIPSQKSLMTALSNLGRALNSLNRPAEAKPYLQQALSISLDLMAGPTAQEATAKIKRNLAMSEAKLGNSAECRRLAEESLAYFLSSGDAPSKVVTEVRKILASCR